MVRLIAACVCLSYLFFVYAMFIHEMVDDYIQKRKREPIVSQGNVEAFLNQNDYSEKTIKQYKLMFNKYKRFIEERNAV